MRYLIFALPLLAQTTVPPSMLRETSALEAPPSQIRLYAGDNAGKLFRVKPGAGLSLRSASDGWVIEATAVQTRLVRRVLQPDANRNYVVSPEAVIYRNGILMTVGVDYQVNASGVLPPSDWTGDLIVALTLEAGGAPVAAVPNDQAAGATLARVEQITNWQQVSNRDQRPATDPLYRAGLGLDQLRPGRIGPAELVNESRCVWWVFAHIRQRPEDSYLLDCKADPPTAIAQQ